MDFHPWMWPFELGIQTLMQLEGPHPRVEVHIPHLRGQNQGLKSISPTRRATRKHGSPYSQLEGPHGSMGVHIPGPMGHVALRLGDMDLHASLWPLESGIWTPMLLFGPWRWGYGLPCFSPAPRVGDVDLHPWFGPSSWGYGPPRFSVALRVEDMDSSHVAQWPLEFRIRTPLLQFCRVIWGYGPPCCRVTPRVGNMDFHPWVWPLELGIWTLPLHFGPWSWGCGLPCLRVTTSSCGYGLPCFSVPPQVEDMEFHRWVWPFKLGIWT